MVTLNAHFDGRVIVPDEPTHLAAGTRLRVTVEPIVDRAKPVSVGIELDMPLLKDVAPEIIRQIMEDPAFDIENAKIERLSHPHVI